MTTFSFKVFFLFFATFSHLTAVDAGQGGNRCSCKLAQCSCHPRGLDTAAWPSSRLLGIRTLIGESAIGFLPIGCSFRILNASLLTVRNSATEKHWLPAAMVCLAAFNSDPIAPWCQGISTGLNTQVDPFSAHSAQLVGSQDRWRFSLAIHRCLQIC